MKEKGESTLICPALSLATCSATLEHAHTRQSIPADISMHWLENGCNL